MPRQLPPVGPPPLDAASNALHDAVHGGNPSGVTRAIKKGADIDSLDPESGETVLMLAGRLRNVKIVELLLKAGASVSTPSVEQYTALHTACLGGNAPIVRRLLKQGASVTSRNKNGDTPFMSAALRGHKEAAELLLDAGADVNACDQNGRTGLMWASTHGFLGDTVAMLLAAGAKHDLYDDKGAQALHNATEYEQLGAMGALIRAGADPNRTRWGRVGTQTPLHMAVRGNHLKAARLLLRAGAVADLKDHNSMTQLHCAVIDSKTAMASEILSHVRRQDSSFSGLDLVAGSSAAGQRSRQQPQYGGDSGTPGPGMRQVLSARNSQGWTALHIAAMVYSVDIVNLLLRYGALETERDRNGKTAFQYPVRCVQGIPIPVLVNFKKVAPNIPRAYRIIQSLSRAGAARARSWLWPFPACASEGTVVAARPVAKQQHATAARILRATNSRRSSLFRRAVGRYVETKGHVILDDGQILVTPRKPIRNHEETRSQLVLA